MIWGLRWRHHHRKTRVTATLEKVWRLYPTCVPAVHICPPAPPVLREYSPRLQMVALATPNATCRTRFVFHKYRAHAQFEDLIIRNEKLGRIRSRYSNLQRLPCKGLVTQAPLAHLAFLSRPGGHPATHTHAGRGRNLGNLDGRLRGLLCKKQNHAKYSRAAGDEP